jgi:Tfp pilus assembly protein PilO
MESWGAWRRLALVWIPAVLLAVASVSLYVWQSSESLGRAASIRNSVADLETRVSKLEKTLEESTGDFAEVEHTRNEMDRIHSEVFGVLDDRLIEIMEAVNDAVRKAGLRAGSFGYQYQQLGDLEAARFGVTFHVEGEYEQLRSMLAALQESPQFFIIDSISFQGEEESPSRSIAISVEVSTCVGGIDKEMMGRSGRRAPARGSR